MAVATERRFLFSPLEERGVIAGLRGGQVTVLVTGLVVAVGCVRADPSGVALAVALVILAVALVLAFVDIAGRPMEQWAPVAGRFIALRLTRRHRTRPGPGAPPVPRPLGGLRIREVSRGPGLTPMAVVTDRRTGTRSAVLAVRGRSFALLDEADKQRRLDAWATVLASLAREGGPVSRIQWVERTAGGDGDALVRHLDGRLALDADSTAARSYRDLVAEAGPLTQEHECYVVLALKRSAGRNVLEREVRLLEGQLANAEVDVQGVLDARELGAALRTAYDPKARTGLLRRGALFPDMAGADVASAWPAATEASWSTYRTDDRWHATFWIAEWPRTEVGPDFLGPLLLHGATQRCVALVMSPASPGEGVREAEAARTAAAADEELRRRAGFMGTARRRREAEALARRETELSDGHAAYRFSGYVSVSSPTSEGLEDACGEIVQVAHQCRLDLRRLYGAQDLAFTWTLPLARGLA
jgi:hypothetical protein